MNKKFFLLGLIFISLILTSCQAIEDAARQTFAGEEIDQIFHEEESEEDSSFFGQILDQEEQIDSFEIIDDIEEKLGYKISSGFNFYLLDYIPENAINRYLSEDEILDIAKAYKDEIIFYNLDKLEKLKSDLSQDHDHGDVLVYQGRIDLYENHVFFQIVNPANHDQVYNYHYYNSDRDEWNKEPYKPGTEINPREENRNLQEIPLEILPNILDQASELYTQIGGQRPIDALISKDGFSYVSIRDRGDGLIYSIRLTGEWEDYDLKFNKDGDLVSQEKR